MITTTLQQIIDERISFLKEQINEENKPEVNKTFQLQMDAIRSAVAAAADDDIEEVEAMIAERKSLLKNCNDVYEFDRISAELEGLEWLQRQRARIVLFSIFIAGGASPPLLKMRNSWKKKKEGKESIIEYY
jgi:hypothetical protein